MLTHDQIARLRRFAGDESYSVAKRLTAIDRLACDAGLYVLRQTRHFPTGSPGTRSRREVIRLLRRLLKSPSPESKRVNTAGIEQRLMLIQTGVSTSCALWKPESKVTTDRAGQQTSLATELDDFLAKHGVYKASVPDEATEEQ
jgi:hypothetical protein